MAAPKSKTAAAGAGDTPANDQVNEQTTASDQKAGADAAVTTSDQSDGKVTTTSQSTAPGEAGGSADAAATDVKLVDAIEVKTVFGLDSFWRSGIKFGQEAKTILLQDLTEVQVEAIKLEKNLIHTLVQVEQKIKDAI